MWCAILPRCALPLPAAVPLSPDFTVSCSRGSCPIDSVATCCCCCCCRRCCSCLRRSLALSCKRRASRAPGHGVVVAQTAPAIRRARGARRPAGARDNACKVRTGAKRAHATIPPDDKRAQ